MAQADLELTTLLLQLPRKSWNYRCEAPCPIAKFPFWLYSKELALGFKKFYSLQLNLFVYLPSGSFASNYVLFRISVRAAQSALVSQDLTTPFDCHLRLPRTSHEFLPAGQVRGP